MNVHHDCTIRDYLGHHQVLERTGLELHTCVAVLVGNILSELRVTYVRNNCCTQIKLNLTHTPVVGARKF